jgi:hypothetical protein
MLTVLCSFLTRLPLTSVLVSNLFELTEGVKCVGNFKSSKALRAELQILCIAMESRYKTQHLLILYFKPCTWQINYYSSISVNFR